MPKTREAPRTLSTSRTRIRPNIGRSLNWLPDTIRMMTENPAKLLGIDDRKGRLLPGKDADVVLFDENVSVKSVYYMGKRVC